MTTPSDDWLLWQLVDSAFPSGGFAHSQGLEAAHQSGLISAGPGLRDFLEAQLRATAWSAAPFMAAAHRDPDRWADADLTCDAFLSNHVSNRASRAQGGAFLSAAERIFRIDRLGDLRRQCRAEKLPGHFAPTFGAALAAMDVGLDRACQLLLFLTARGIVSSAVRLGVVGPMEGQSIQHAMAGRIDHWARVAPTIDPDAAAQTSPALDLIQATQDRLYSRLFQS